MLRVHRSPGSTALFILFILHRLPNDYEKWVSIHFNNLPSIHSSSFWGIGSFLFSLMVIPMLIYMIFEPIKKPWLKRFYASIFIIYSLYICAYKIIFNILKMVSNEPSQPLNNSQNELQNLAFNVIIIMIFIAPPNSIIKELAPVYEKSDLREMV